MIVIVGQSPFADTSVGVGPFRSRAVAAAADAELVAKGWNTEIIDLVRVSDVETVHNDEGADDE